MESCDVLIIGGGPAGSSCARALQRAGFDVVIMDKMSFPRRKLCAGWITPFVIDALNIDTRDYARGRVLQPIKGMRVGVMDRKPVLTEYGCVVSYGILRHEFDDYLLRRCGARLRLGEQCAVMAKSGRRWRVNDSIEADLIIGAGGHFCPVARHLGAKPGSERVARAQEIEIEMTPDQSNECLVSGETPEIYFCEDLNGYAWCFRKGNHLNIGIGREDSKSLNGHAREFLDVLRSRGRIPRDVCDKFHGHAYILHGHARRELIADGMLLIGDAAGLAYRESGEGIRTAVESGLLAAETIRSLEGDYRRARLEPYVKKLVSRFGKPRTAAPLTGVTGSIVRTLLGTKWYSRHVVLDHFFFRRHESALVAEQPTSYARSARARYAWSPRAGRAKHRSVL